MVLGVGSLGQLSFIEYGVCVSGNIKYARWFEFESTYKNRFHVVDEETKDDDRCEEDSSDVLLGHLNPPNMIICPNPAFNTDSSEPPFHQYFVDPVTGFKNPRPTVRQPRWLIMDGNKVCRQRRCPRLVSTPPLHAMESMEAQYSFLVLHMPHRNEPFDILASSTIDHGTVEAAFKRYKEIILVDSISGTEHYLANLNKIIAELDDLPYHLRDYTPEDVTVSEQDSSSKQAPTRKKGTSLITDPLESDLTPPVVPDLQTIETFQF